MYIKEFYKNKKQNIHIIILFLIIIIIVIYLWPNYFSNSLENFNYGLLVPYDQEFLRYMWTTGGGTGVPPPPPLEEEETRVPPPPGEYIDPSIPTQTPRPTPTQIQRAIYSLPNGTMIANIPETSRVYSTYYDDGRGNLLNQSTLDSSTCWAPAINNNNTNQSVKLNLSSPTKIYGIVIMGRADYIFDYVKSFKVNYIPSTSTTPLPIDNGMIFNSYLYTYKVADGVQRSYILFSVPIIAKSIIIIPQSWSKSTAAMKVDLLIDYALAPTQAYVLPSINGLISSPVFIPKEIGNEDYISNNTDILDSLNNSYDSIKTERHINLDNQDRILKLEKRINKIKLDIIDIVKSSKNTKIKAPKFY